jgi:hypothetical protein
MAGISTPQVALEREAAAPGITRARGAVGPTRGVIGIRRAPPPRAAAGWPLVPAFRPRPVRAVRSARRPKLSGRDAQWRVNAFANCACCLWPTDRDTSAIRCVGSARIRFRLRETRAAAAGATCERVGPRPRARARTGTRARDRHGVFGQRPPEPQSLLPEYARLIPPPRVDSSTRGVGAVSVARCAKRDGVRSWRSGPHKARKGP